MREPRALDTGILIIGSLLWDEDRQQWRDERLDLSRSELVSAPIRYGRKSGRRRGRTYTMVFSKSAPAGSARVVRCSHAITSANDLIAELCKTSLKRSDLDILRKPQFPNAIGFLKATGFRNKPKRTIVDVWCGDPKWFGKFA
jgi:hypothetical protein